MQNLTFRLATPSDLSAIHAIELDAIKKFSDIPELAWLATAAETSETMGRVTTQQYQEWLDLGRVYLACHAAGEPVGMIAALPRDGMIYVHEVVMRSEYAGKGIGRLLLKKVFDWAREAEKRVSLTCYADVPWNGAWYRKNGFREVEVKDVGPWHVEKMRYDAEVRELSRTGYRRCCMVWTGEDV